jgi:hypothetical protein
VEVGEVLSHLIDGERVRLPRVLPSRGAGPAAELTRTSTGSGASRRRSPWHSPGSSGRCANRTWLLRRLDAADWTGSASPAASRSVRALAWIMAGHPRHHLAVLRERYDLA